MRASASAKCGSFFDVRSTAWVMSRSGNAVRRTRKGCKVHKADRWRLVIHQVPPRTRIQQVSVPRIVFSNHLARRCAFMAMAASRLVNERNGF